MGGKSYRLGTEYGAIPLPWIGREIDNEFVALAAIVWHRGSGTDRSDESQEAVYGVEYYEKKQNEMLNISID